MNMKRLAIFRSFTFAILAMLLTANLWAQEPAPAALSGSGTENNPYKITSAAEWNTFAGNSDYWALGIYVRLDADIEVSTMAGTNSHKYQGIFDGNWHTLTFNNGTLDEPCTVEKCAPFSFAGPGTTIKNLTVEGTIISQKSLRQV